MAVYPWAWSVFVPFVLMSAFIIYNLIVAVVCDAVALVESQHKMHQEQDKQEEEAGLVLEYPGDDQERIGRMQQQLSMLIRAQYEVLASIEDALQDVEQLTLAGIQEYPAGTSVEAEGDDDDYNSMDEERFDPTPPTSLRPPAPPLWNDESPPNMAPCPVNQVLQVESSITTSPPCLSETE
jgi:hypothetical protein